MLTNFAKFASTVGVITLLAAPAFGATPTPSSALAATSSSSDNSVTLPIVSVRLTPNYAVRRERHPEIRKAITALERAKSALQSAAHDFGGHRADALASCDNAIAQLKLALQFDR